jgi:hypothetical protein
MRTRRSSAGVGQGDAGVDTTACHYNAADNLQDIDQARVEAEGWRSCLLTVDGLIPIVQPKDTNPYVVSKTLLSRESLVQNC